MDIEPALWEPQLLLVLGANHGGVKFLHLKKIRAEKAFQEFVPLLQGFIFFKKYLLEF